MARERLELQRLLERLLGSRAVYFQPPNNIQLVYPCIIYERDNVDVDYADNLRYRDSNRYSVTVIDQNPDSEISLKIAALPFCSYSRSFPADNLNHDVYSLYF